MQSGKSGALRTIPLCEYWVFFRFETYSFRRGVRGEKFWAAGNRDNGRRLSGQRALCGARCSLHIIRSLRQMQRECALEQQMKSSTKIAPKSVREISYYRQRYRNRVFSKLVSFITEQAQRDHLSQKEIAEVLNKDPGQISRALSQPSNLTLDTISDFLLAFDAEAEPPEIISFKERRAPNYIHPLMARVLNVQPQQSALQSNSSSSISAKLPAYDPAKLSVRIETRTTAGQ